MQGVKKTYISINRVIRPRPFLSFGYTVVRAYSKFSLVLGVER